MSDQRRGVTYAEALELLVGLRDQTANATDDLRAFVNFCLHNVGWSRGQHLQDLWAAYESGGKRDGYFVEFGAMDGIMYSNSYGLETHLSWRGIVAEPARMWRDAIHRNRTCAVDDRCVWVRSGETLTFNQATTSPLSTIDSYSDSDAHADLRRDGERYDVQTVSLDDLLAHWQAPRAIDYLSIDTEGSEYDILHAFDWSRHDIRLISVEHNHTPKRDQLFALLGAHGYRRKFESVSLADDWYVKAG